MVVSSSTSGLPPINRDTLLHMDSNLRTVAVKNVSMEGAMTPPGVSEAVLGLDDRAKNNDLPGFHSANFVLAQAPGRKMKMSPDGTPLLPAAAIDRGGPDDGQGWIRGK